MQEVENAANRMRNKKVGGIDEITEEIVKKIVVTV